MNKVQKSLEELLIHPTNFEDVIIEKNSLDKMFTNYTKCCRDYEDSLSHQEEVEHGKMVEEYNSVCRNNEELDYRLEEWLKEVQEKPKVQIPEDFVHEKRATFRVEDHGCAKGNEFINIMGVYEYIVEITKQSRANNYTQRQYHPRRIIQRKIGQVS